MWVALALAQDASEPSPSPEPDMPGVESVSPPAEGEEPASLEDDAPSDGTAEPASPSAADPDPPATEPVNDGDADSPDPVAPPAEPASPAPEPPAASVDPEPEPPAPEPQSPTTGVALSGGTEVEAGPMGSVEVVAPGTRLSTDIEVWVRRDGNFYLDDTLVMATDLPLALGALEAQEPGARVVISSDDNAPHGRILEAVRAANAAGIERIAMVVEGVDTVDTVDPLFPGAAGMEGVELTELETGLTKAQQRKLRPKRWKFPQNPYAQTDYTAYTLEWGETKIGVTNLTYGLFPRIQVGTVPALDLVGVWNASLKANLMREGPLDGALLGQVYVVPVNNLIERWDRNNDFGLFGTDASGNTTFTTSISVVALGAMTSLQVAKPWSVHAGAHYLRIGVAGALDVQNLPEIVLPGIDPIGGEFELVPRVVGELVQVRFSSDYRFNRRDSLVLQGQAPVYARARAALSASVGGLPEEVDNVDLIVAYGQGIPLDAAYRVALSYQLSWKHVDLRFGAGISPLPFVWGLNAFDLSYRFGGRTRSNERAIRKGYRASKRDMRQGGDVVPESEAPADPPPPTGDGS